MENIRERGAEVVYNVPRWFEDELKEILEENEAEKKAKET